MDYSDPATSAEAMVAENEQDQADEMRAHLARGGGYPIPSEETRAWWGEEHRRQQAAFTRRTQTYQLARYLEGDERTSHA